MKKLIGLFVVLLFCTSVLALSPSDLTWNGLGQIHLDKSTYDANEPITGSVYLSNLESFPIVSGKIIFQIAQGDYVYPSQESADNLVEEAFISDIWALPNSTKKIDFVLPAQRSGDYRLDIYAWVVKSKLIGSSSILYNPISKSFSVKGTAEKRVVIDRKKTVFGSKDTVGPVGFAVNLDEEFNGVVVVRNDSGKAQKNLELEISMCYWAIPFCDDPETFKFPVENLSVNEEKQIDVNLLAPLLSSAYEINIVLKSEKGIESMYKNRIIVMGPTAEARKVFLKGLGTKNYSISVVFAGSPDHFSNPVFENFTVATEALVSGKVIERKTADVFSLATGEIINQDFPLNSKFFDEVCVKAEKAGIVYEEECFSVDLEAIENAYDDKLALPVSVSWNYLENNSSLEIKLRKALINARIILLDGENTIYEEQIKNANSEIKRKIIL